MRPQSLIDEARLLLDTMPSQDGLKELRQAVQALRRGRSPKEMFIWSLPDSPLLTPLKDAMRAADTALERSRLVDAFIEQHGAKRIGAVLGDGGPEQVKKRGTKRGIESILR